MKFTPEKISKLPSDSVLYLDLIRMDIIVAVRLLQLRFILVLF